MTKFLLAYDGSPGAKRALVRAASLAVPGDEVTILSVVPAIVQAFARNAEDRAANIARREEQATDARRTLFLDGVPSATQVAEGDPAVKIWEVAADGAYDVIILGSRHRHGVQRFTHRSVSTYVIRHAPCDVIVAH